MAPVVPRMTGRSTVPALMRGLWAVTINTSKPGQTFLRGRVVPTEQRGLKSQVRTQSVLYGSIYLKFRKRENA